MSRSQRLVFLAMAVILPLPLLALAQSIENERAVNQARLVELRQNRGLYRQVLQQASAFLALKPEDQEQLRQLDNHLHDLPGTQREELQGVMRRYYSWVRELPEKDREFLRSAANDEEKIRRVHLLREEEWIRTLPRIQREQIAKAQGEERQKLIEKYRWQEKCWNTRWQIAMYHWDDLIKKRPMPGRLEDLPPKTRIYVNEYLRPLLSETEWKKLKDSEGKWPLFPCTLVTIADKHPIALPGQRGPTSFKELPAKVRERILRGKAMGRVRWKQVEGKWPQFGTAVAEASNHQRLPLSDDFELWPTRFADLSIPMREFVNDRLRPMLNEQDQFQLRMAEGSWPSYPQTIQGLAQKNALMPPWQTLPGSRRDWDSYRISNPATIKNW